MSGWRIYKQRVSRSFDKAFIILFILLRRFKNSRSLGTGIGINPCTDHHQTSRNSTALEIPPASSPVKFHAGDHVDPVAGEPYMQFTFRYRSESMSAMSSTLFGC